MVGGPGPPRERRWREIGIPERTTREVFGNLDEIARAIAIRGGGHRHSAFRPSRRRVGFGVSMSPSVTFSLVASVVGLRVGPPDLRMCDDTVAAKPPEIVE